MVWNEPGKDKDPWNSAERPPDLERMAKNLHKRLSWLFGNKRGGQYHFHAATLWWLLPVIMAAWLVSGFYEVTSGDRGVYFVFGRYMGVAQPGLHWHVPWPVGYADIISGVEGRDYAHSYNQLLTSDDNIVVVDALVHYHVTDLRDYLFNAGTSIRTPESADAGSKIMLGALADAAVRAAVARSTLASILGSGQDAVETDARQQLDVALKPYNTGIAVTRLVFQRVSVPEAVSTTAADVRTAQQDASQAQDTARAYADNLLPQAQGTADAKLTEAEAYRTILVSQAEADIARFDAVLVAYRKAPALTRDALYLQTMEDILANANKVVVDARNGSVTVQLGQSFQSPNEPAVRAPEKPPAKNATTSAHPATAIPTAAPAASTGKEGA